VPGSAQVGDIEARHVRTVVDPTTPGRRSNFATVRLQRMPTRQRIVTYGFTTAAAATITVALCSSLARRSHRRRARPITRPTPVVVKHPVDVVFAVDTTARWAA